MMPEKKMTKKNITTNELATVVKQGFQSQERKFDKKIDNLAGMMKRGFDDVDKRFESVFSLLMEKPDRDELKEKADKKDIDRLLTAIDNYASKADTYFQEMLMLSHKVDRLERWILQIAEKINIQLAA